MLIDWFTVSAQAINFFVLVWLMKRFLYKPVLEAIDAREKKIATELNDAKEKQQEAKAKAEDLDKKNTAFDQQRADLLAKAQKDAKEEKERLLDEAKKSVRELSQKWRQTLSDEEKSFRDTLKQRTQREVFLTARKALADLAGVSLEDRIIDTFIQRLHGLSEQDKKQMLKALSEGGGPLVVHSTASLSNGQQEKLGEAVKTNLGEDLRLRFETAPDLVSGIELVFNGHKIAWSIADYLASMQKGLDELIGRASETREKNSSGET